MKSQQDVVRIHQSLESGRLFELQGDNIVEEIHRERYKMAGTYCSGKKVLDIATGIGYGAYLLATSGRASTVVGVDVSDEAINAAANAYQAPNLHFQKIEGEPIPFEDASFDAVVSLETIEHTADERAFLLDLNRVLKPGGDLIISTPNKRFHSWGKERPWNPHHTVEFYPEQFLVLILDVFGKPVFWGGQEFLPLGLRTTIKYNWVEIQYYELRHHPRRKKLFDKLIGLKHALVFEKNNNRGIAVNPKEIPLELIDNRCRVVPWIDNLEPYTMVAVCRKESN